MKSLNKFIPLLAGAAIGFLTASLIRSNKEVTSHEENWQNQLSELETTLNEKLDSLKGEIAKEIGVLFPLEIQGAGENFQIAPIQMPIELSQFIEAMEHFDEDSTLDTEEMDAKRLELQNAINKLPVYKRQEFADQINFADWSLNLLDLFADDPSADDLLIQLMLAQKLAELRPAILPKKLEDALVRRTMLLVELAESRIRILGNSSSLEDLREGALINEFILQTGLLNDNADSDRLHVNLAAHEWLDDMSDLTGDPYGSDEEFDLARYSLIEDGSSIVDFAVALRVALPDDFLPALNRLSEDLASDQRDKQERLSSEYQLWALGQIEIANEMIGESAAENIGEWLKEAKKFPDNEYFEILKYFEEGRAPKFKLALLDAAYEDDSAPVAINKHNIPEIVDLLDQLTGWKNQSEMAQALTADALLIHLMLIDESLLDRPVAALYSESFLKAWNYLEGTDYRLAVAREGVEISKREFGGGGPN